MSIENELYEIVISEDFESCYRDEFYELIDNIRYIDCLHANLLLIAYDAGMFDDIYNEYIIDQDFYDSHVQKLLDEFGLSEQSANWIVDTCCNVYGKSVLELNCTFSKNEIEKDHNKDSKTSRSNKTAKISCNPINTASLKKGGKIPKAMIQKVPVAEKELNIEDLALTATFDGGYGDKDWIKVVGEISSSDLKYDVVIFIMIYNDENQIIGASFRDRIDQDECNGFASFSSDISIPKGEYISKIIVRPVQNPAGFW